MNVEESSRGQPIYIQLLRIESRPVRNSDVLANALYFGPSAIRSGLELGILGWRRG